FDDNPPRAARLVGHAGGAEHLDRRAVELGSGRKVIDAPRLSPLLQVVEEVGEPGKILLLADISRAVVNVLREPAPGVRVELLADELRRALGELPAPLLVAEGSPRKADDLRIVGEPPLAMELVEGRNQLPLSEVP